MLLGPDDRTIECASSKDFFNPLVDETSARGEPDRTAAPMSEPQSRGAFLNESLRAAQGCRSPALE
jgi:hypothetical protein